MMKEILTAIAVLGMILFVIPTAMWSIFEIVHVIKIRAVVKSAREQESNLRKAYYKSFSKQKNECYQQALNIQHRCWKAHFWANYPED